MSVLFALHFPNAAEKDREPAAVGAVKEVITLLYYFVYFTLHTAFLSHILQMKKLLSYYRGLQLLLSL